MMIWRATQHEDQVGLRGVINIAGWACMRERVVKQFSVRKKRAETFSTKKKKSISTKKKQKHFQLKKK
jgi:hypothetical protein